MSKLPDNWFIELFDVVEELVEAPVVEVVLGMLVVMPVS
jgi:hypothetical protein